MHLYICLVISLLQPKAKLNFMPQRRMPLVTDSFFFFLTELVADFYFVKLQHFYLFVD